MQRGEFTFEGLAEGRYHVEVQPRADSSRGRRTAVFVGASRTRHRQVRTPGRAASTQHVVVTAAAAELPQSQVGASVTVIDAALLDALGNTDLLEPLRTVPGAAVVQTGARGGTTSLFVRGGASNFTKVLIDGVPANDIGGAFDFADLATTGVERVEVLRGSNSVLYGSDALTGVVNITTRRGRSRIPEGDPLDRRRQPRHVSRGRVDRRRGRRASITSASVSHLQTDNSVPNNAYRNTTFASRFGVHAGHDDRASAARCAASTRPSAARTRSTTSGSPTIRSQTRDDRRTRRLWRSPRSHPAWQSTVRFSVADQDYHYVNPSPTGERSDPSAVRQLPRQHRRRSPAATDTRSPARAILDFSGDLSVDVRLQRHTPISCYGRDRRTT